MNRLLIIRFSSLGDIILTEPIVRTLRAAYPQAELHFLTKSRYERLLSLLPGVDRVHAYDADRRDQLLAELKSASLDAVIDLHNNLRSRFVTKKLGVLAYRTNKQWLRRVAAVKFKKLHVKPSHAIDRYVAALKPLNLNLTGRHVKLAVPVDASQWWSAERTRINRQDSYYVLAAGAANPTKQAPAELWRRIHAQLKARGFDSPVFVGSNSERPFLDEVAGSIEGAVVVCEEDILRTAAILRSARFVISNDSGLAHLAAGLGAPILSLFGPTHPILGFAPVGANADFYTVNEYCSPCSLHGKKPCYRRERYCFNLMNENVIGGKIRVLVDSKASSSNEPIP